MLRDNTKRWSLLVVVLLTLTLTGCEVADSLNETIKVMSDNSKLRVQIEEDYYKSLPLQRVIVEDFWIDTVTYTAVLKSYNMFLVQTEDGFSILKHNNDIEGKLEFKISEEEYSYLTFKSIPENITYVSDVKDNEGNPIQVTILKAEVLYPTYYVRRSGPEND